MNDQLKNERDRFVAFAFAGADILVELGPDGKIVFADGATFGLLGRRAEDMCTSSFTSLLHPEDSRPIAEWLEDGKDHTRLDEVSVRLLSKENEPLPFLLTGYQVPYLDNHYYLTLSLAKSRHAEQSASRRDWTTGLLRKEAFVKEATQMIHAQQEGANLKMTLIDFPELKKFLDHLQADQARGLLGEIGEYLRSVASDGELVSNIGEQSYSVIHTASHTMEKICSSLHAITTRSDPKGQGITPQASTLDMDPGSITEQDTANALIYTLNKFAENKVEGFSLSSLTDGYQALLNETISKMADFKKTVDETTFEIALQPIVDLKTGLVHHHESLVRFDEQLPFANAFSFITFGEQTNMITGFDLAMCQKTLTLLSDLGKKGKYPTVAVNLSGRSLSSSLFMDTLANLVKEHEAVGPQLIFEVTESAKISDLKIANKFIQSMRKSGILCCLDDFGVAESSFEYLRNLQVDFVKIDGSYVRESLTTTRGKHLLKALAAMCRDLHIVTIGEMVEDEKVAALLWECGVKFGQGYLFGKPTTDIEQALAEANRTHFHHGMLKAKKISSQQRKWWIKQPPATQ